MPETVSVKPEEIVESCKNRYATFCRIMQDPGWFDPVHEQLCDFIQYWIEDAMSRAKDAKILVVLPRGSLKSTIVTKYLPIWLTLSDVNNRSLIATNTMPNAGKKMQDIRGVFESNEKFRQFFPEMQPTRKCRWTNEAAELPRTKAFPEATFEACGRKTKKTGTHYNVIIEDDTTAPQDSDMSEDLCLPSQEEVQSAIGWHKSATPLLVPKGKRIRVVVTTRWADYDLVAYLLDNEKGWKLFDVPAMDEDGNPKFSMMYDEEKLSEIREQMGPYMFSALFLNSPMDASLRVFRDEYLHEIEVHELPDYDYYTVAVDPAISKKDEACETAITLVQHKIVGGRQPFQYWVKDLHGHYEPKETVTKTCDLIEEHGIDACKGLIIETIAFQEALKYAFRDEFTKRGWKVPLIPYDSQKKKDVKIRAMEPAFANGRIFLSKGLTPQVISQLKQYPHGRLVDIIDSFSMHRKKVQAEKGDKAYKSQVREEISDLDQLISEIKARKSRKGGLKRFTSSMDEGEMVPLSTGDKEKDMRLYFGGLN